MHPGSGPSRRGILAGGAAMLLPAACASPVPTLFTLGATSGPVQSGGPAVVAVRDISLARYLDRPAVVRSTEDYRVDLTDNERWAEPLGSMFVRILVLDLSQRLPKSMVFADSGAISTSDAALVEINLQSMGADATGALVMVAQLSVVPANRSRKPLRAPFRASVAPPSADTAGLVAAMSTALGQLADKVATMLRTA